MTSATEIVLVGAGHAHVQVLKHFGSAPVPGVRLTLISPDRYTPYSGMLPGLIAGFYSFHDTHIDCEALCRFAGAAFRQDRAVGLDQDAKLVRCADGASVPYDIVSIDTGSTPNTEQVPGAADHAIPVKPISRFLDRFEALKERVLKASRSHRIVLVGGGAGGVELMLSLERRLRSEVSSAGHDPDRLSFTLVTASSRLLPEFPRHFARRFARIFEQRAIAIHTDAEVMSVEDGAVAIDRRGRIEADDVLWVTQAQAPEWLATTGLPLSEDGFLRVDQTLRAEGTTDIFAAGDVITFTPRPLPKSGVYAVRAGPVLADNIKRLVRGRSLKPFRPQRRALYLISTGERHAIGTRNGLVVSGEWVWRWKDWIDRRFMNQFHELEPDRER